MGSFLIELLVQIAALRCIDSNGAVYLRANTSSEAFYSKHSFGDATWLGDDLIKNAPVCHYAVDNDTKILCRPYNRSVTNEVTDAAEVMAGLHTSPAASKDPTLSISPLPQVHWQFIKSF